MQGQQVLDRQVGAGERRERQPEHEQRPRRLRLVGAERPLDQDVGGERVDQQHRCRADGDDHQRAGEDRPRVLPLGAQARNLRDEVEAGSHRDPDQHLGGDRDRAVGTRDRGREAVLGADDVDVLQHGDDDQPGDRRPRPAHVRPQAQRGRRQLDPGVQRLAGLGLDVGLQPPPAVQAHRHERQRRAPVGAGDAGAGGRQRHAGDQPGALLTDEADADALVVADPLQDAAQHRQLQPEPGAGNPRAAAQGTCLTPTRSAICWRSSTEITASPTVNVSSDTVQRRTVAISPPRCRAGRARPRARSPPAAPGRRPTGSGSS